MIHALWSGGRSPDARAYATQAAGDAAAPSPRTPAIVLSATGAAASAVACAAAEADPTHYDATFDAPRIAELAAQAALLRELIPHRAMSPRYRARLKAPKSHPSLDLTPTWCAPVMRERATGPTQKNLQNWPENPVFS